MLLHNVVIGIIILFNNVEQQVSIQGLESLIESQPLTVVKESAVPACVGKLKRATQRQQEPMLPNPFPLPRNFPPIVALELKEKKLTSKARAKFVTTLAHAIHMHKSYPTSKELENVSREAMKTWEFLATSSGCVSSLI